MANLGDKLTIGDREGVVVRAVGVAGGTEYTVVVPHEDSTRPVSANGLGNEDELPTDPETTDNPLDRRLVDVDAAPDPDAPASQKPTGDDKPLTKAPAKASGTTTKAPAKGADTK